MGRHETFDPSNAVLADLTGGTTLSTARERLIANAALHPGFMPYPTAEPTYLVAIDIGLRQEGERLLALAKADYDRLYPYQIAPRAGAERAAASVRLRRELRLDALEALAREEIADADANASVDAVSTAIETHRTARAALGEVCNPADETFVRQAGRDTSDKAMAPAREAWEAASDADTEAWDALIAARPGNAAGLALMLRYIAGSPASEIVDDPQYLLAHLAEAAEAVAAVDSGPALVSAPSPVTPIESAPSHPDAGMIALCEEAVREESAAVARCNAIGALPDGEVEPDHFKRSYELLVRATATRPATLEGLASKARLLLTHTDDVDELGTDERCCALALSIAHDTARLSRGGEVSEAAMAPSVGADAALLALGREFDAAHAAWLELTPAANAANTAIRAFLDNRKARTGRNTVADDEAACAQPGVRDALDREETAFETLDPFYKAIRAMPARTLQGLAVKARMLSVAAWPTGTYRKEVRIDEDLPNSHIRDLIEATCALAGVDVMGRPRGVKSEAEPTTSATDGDLALWQAIGAHRQAYRALSAATNPADEVWVKQNGGDASDAAMAPARATWKAASERSLQAWRDLFNVRPGTASDLLALLRYVAEHFDGHRAMEAEPDVFGALIGAVEGMRFAGLAEAKYDLSRLAVAELEFLADACRRQSQAYLAIYNQPICQELTGIVNESILGGIMDDEYNRIGILGGDAVAELERRRPADDEERNLILEARIRSHLSGNGYIEPGLVAEIVEAWGA